MAIRDANGLSPSGAVTKELDHKQHEVSREQAGAAGSLLVSALLPGAAFVGWVFAMNRVATPAGGAPATPAFYRDISLVLPAVVTALYTAMCLVGPRLMCNRQPIELKGAMLVYNLYQTLLSIWSVALFIWEVRKIGAKPWGNTEAGVEHLEWVDQARYGRLMWVLWLHYNNKYVELLDSVFMILRKKTEQLSFLHCYHHALLIWAWVLVMRLMVCMDAYFGATCNSLIHAIMYSYYLLAALGVPCPWKKYITQAQLLQFVVCLSHALYIQWVGCCGNVLPASQLFVMVNMLYLFGQFYVKAYSKKKAAAAARRGAGKEN